MVRIFTDFSSVPIRKTRVDPCPIPNGQVATLLMSLALNRRACYARDQPEGLLLG
jgi:hypothetical protein